MHPTASALPFAYLWGDMLSDRPEASLWRRMLPGLFTALPGVEARGFARPQAGSGRPVTLSDGARTWTVSTMATDAELDLVRRAAASTVPAGSPVLAFAVPGLDPAVLRALVPEAGTSVLLAPEECPADGAGLAQLLASRVAGEPRPPVDVVFTAPVLGPSGYATEGRVMFECLEAHPGVRVCLRPLRFGRTPCGEDHAFLLRVREASARTPQEGYVAVHLVLPRQFLPDPGARANVLRTMYETDGVPPGWLPPLAEADEIWVPSRFHVRSFARAGIEERRLRVVPESVPLAFDPAPFATQRAARRARGGPTVFLSVFDWSERKAPDLLLRCFGRAFRAGEALLRLKVHSSLGRSTADLHGEARRLVAEGAASAGHPTPPIEILEDMPAPSAMPALYAGADAFVLASRGEGWGRPLHEAMAMGLPVVATAFGGTQDLLGAPGVGYLVAGRVVPCRDSAVAEVPELAGQSWLEPDARHLVRRLREVHENRVEAAATGERARRHVLRWFHPARVGARIVELCHGAASLPATAPSESPPRPRVMMEGPLFGTASYACIHRHLGRALRARGELDLSVHDPLPPALVPDRDRDLLHLLATRDRGVDLCIRSGWPVSTAPPDADIWVQRVDWEYGALPVELAGLLAHGPDEVWVHSRHVRETLIASGVPVGRIWTVGHGVDPQRFHPDRTPLPAIVARKDGRFAFLFVGGAIWRKGADLLLKAWLKAFRRSDPVCLLVRGSDAAPAYAGQGIADLFARAARLPGAAPIHLLDEELSDDDMGALYCAADALVHPYRGEGFGLPILEAQACARPVILTAGGAADDFVDPRGAWPLPARQVPVELRELCAGRPWVWEPDLEALVQALHAVSRQARDDEMLHTVACDLQRRHSWNEVARRTEGRIRDLLGARRRHFTLA